MLVATTAFTVLTAAARTAQIRTIGTVNAHVQPAYDILVRPAGARSSLESATGIVQPDLLSGTYGGITLAQWHQIQEIGGATRIPQPASYVYVTPDRVHFSFAAQAGASCWSQADGDGTPPGTTSYPHLNGHAGFSVNWQFPVLATADGIGEYRWTTPTASTGPCGSTRGPPIR